MNRNEVIAKLKERSTVLRNMGATELYLFGSMARDETTVGSDVDIFIEYDRGRRFSLFDLVSLKQFLEDEIATAVDITTRSSLHPELKNEIENSAIRVF